MTSLEEYPVMVKNPLLAYIIGQSGLVASDTTNVCCSVASAVLSSCDTLGIAPMKLESSDVRFDSAPLNRSSDVLLLPVRFDTNSDDVPLRPHSAVRSAMVSAARICSAGPLKAIHLLAGSSLSLLLEAELTFTKVLTGSGSFSSMNRRSLPVDSSILRILRPGIAMNSEPPAEVHRRQLKWKNSDTMRGPGEKNRASMAAGSDDREEPKKKWRTLTGFFR